MGPVRVVNIRVLAWVCMGPYRLIFGPMLRSNVGPYGPIMVCSWARIRPILGVCAGSPALGLIIVGLVCKQIGNCRMEPESNHWPSTYVKLYRLGIRWKCNILVKVSGGELNHTILKAMARKDENVIEDVFALFTQTTMKTYFPRICLEKKVCDSFFEERIKECGDRWKGWAKKAIVGGDVDWTCGGPYTLIWDDAAGRALAVKHISGMVVELPQKVIVDRSFKFQNPQSEEHAMLISEDGQVPLKLMNLFSKTSLHGPWTHHIGDDKELIELSTYYRLEQKFMAQLDRAQTDKATSAAIDLQLGDLGGDEEAMKIERKERAALKAKVRMQEKKDKGSRVLKIRTSK